MTHAVTPYQTESICSTCDPCGVWLENLPIEFKEIQELFEIMQLGKVSPPEKWSTVCGTC